MIYPRNFVIRSAKNEIKKVKILMGIKARVN